MGNVFGEEVIDMMVSCGWFFLGVEIWFGEVFVVLDSESLFDACVRVYLYSNCVGCHCFGVAVVCSEMDLCYIIFFVVIKICGIEFEYGSLYGVVKNAWIIRSGVSEEFVLYCRMTTFEVFCML